MAKLYFRYSAMNAGKSTALLQVAHNYLENKMDVRLFTAEVDDRYGRGQITSRMGPFKTAMTYNARFNFSSALQNLKIRAVLIDEAQFLTPEQVRQLHELAHLADLPVLCYGLRTDFRGEPFSGAAYLLALADDIEEIKTICACGKKATMNLRMDAAGGRVTQGEQVEIGGNDRYRQVCARCFYLG